KFWSRLHFLQPENAGQADALDFARSPFGDIVQNYEFPRYLERGQLAGGEFLKLAERQFLAFDKHNGRRHLLTQSLVRHAKSDDLPDRRMLDQHIIDFQRRNLLAAAIDDLLYPCRNLQIAFLVQEALVPGAEPSVDET